MPNANPYEALMQGSIATGAAENPAQPASNNPYEALMQDVQDQETTRLRAQATLAVGVNPDEVARARRTASFLGVPPAAVEALPAETSQQAKIKKIDQDSEAAPVLRQRYTDADFARLAHDDSGALSAVEKAVRYLVSADDSGGLMRDLGAGVFRASAGSAGVFRAGLEAIAPALDPLAGRVLPENPLRRIAAGFGAMGDQAEASAKRMSPPSDGLIGNSVSSGVQSLAGNLLMLPLALLPGGAAAALAGMSSQAGGQAYQQGRAQGMEPTPALAFAASQAAIEYATEKLPVSLLVKDLKAGSSFWKTLGHNLATELPGEQVATVLQDLNEWAVLPENASKPFSAYLAERPSAALQTAIATAIGVGGQVTVLRAAQGVVDAAAGRQTQAAQADTYATRLQELVQISEGSLLRGRDAETFAQFADEAAGGAVAHVDAATLAETLQQSGITPEQFAQLSPTAAAALPDALQAGSSVEIPLGDLVGRMAGTSLEQALIPHLRQTEDALSQEEARQVTAEAQNLLAQEAQRVAEQAAQQAQEQTSAEKVHAEVLGQLNTAGRFTADVNGAYAALVRDFYATQAARAGVTAEQLYQQFPLKITAQGLGELAQGAGSAPRATFSPQTLTISLLEKADLSSFLHETGHFFLEAMAGMTAAQGSPASTAQDMATVLQWFGVQDLAAWQAMTLDQQRKYHEQFAESFEQYLFEGKAPSKELQPLFARFRAWLTNVYQSLAQFMGSYDTRLSDEVRAVFDRLLATDAQIQEQQAARAYAPLFQSAEAAGMTPEQWAAYQQQGAEATMEAVTDLQRRSLRDLRWVVRARSKALREISKDVAAMREGVEAEVTREVDATPEMQAKAQMDAMTAASPEDRAAIKEWRDRRAAALEQAREEGKAALLASPEAAGLKGIKKGQFLAKNKRLLENEAERKALEWERANPRPRRALPALDLDVIAEQHGFDSGDRMLKAIDAFGPRDVAIEGMTDQRMLERYGDLATPAGAARAADEAVHNEARARFVASELKALAEGMNARTETGGTVSYRRKDGTTGKRTQTVNVLVRAARDFAQQLVARKRVRDLKPAQHSAAETRAARRALEAVAAGKTQEALVAKRDQLLNFYATKATNGALQEVERGVDYLNRVQDSDSLPPDYRDQIDTLLERFDLRRGTTLREIDRHASLAAWMESQREMGIEPDIPVELVNESLRKSYKEMTVEEFRGLVDTVKQIEHLGRLKGRLLTSKDKRDFEAARDQIADSIVANAGDRSADTRTPNTVLGSALVGLKKFWASHIKTATLARVMDGGKDGGPVWEYLIRTANDAGNNEVTMRAKATQDLSALLKPLIDAGAFRLGKGTLFPSINRSLNREAVLAMALNTGNASNMQRLLGGEGWTEAQLAPVLASMTSQEWQVVQGIWDYFESYRPQVAEKERRVSGREPEWIEAVPREVNTADGKTVRLRGGYYPVKYDTRASERAESHADAEAARQQMQGAYTSATTRRSFTKQRAEDVVGRPLLYSLDGVYNGVQEIIHDLSWHEFLIDANRLTKDQKISSAMREHYGPEAHQQFKSWLQDVAQGEQGARNAGEQALGWIRQGVSVAGLGINVTNALLQPLGATQSIVRIGAGYFGRGLAKYVGAPIQTVDEINGKSEFMRTRSMTRLRELAEVRAQVKGRSKARQAIDGSAYFLMLRAQQMVDVPTWWGAYEKAIGEGNAEDRAVALADQAVIDSQGSGTTKDLSAIERGSPALKLFTTFYSFFNTALNLGVQQTMTADSKAKLAADYLLIFIVPAVLGDLIKQALTPGGDDDDWTVAKLAKKLAGAEISYLMGLLFGVREVTGAVQAITGTNEYAVGYAGPGGLRPIEAVTKLGQQVNQGEMDTGLRKAVINAAGYLLRLPAAQINRSITGAEALADGKTENPLAIFFGYQEPK